MTAVHSGESSKGDSSAGEWESMVLFLRAAGVHKQSYSDFDRIVAIDWPANRLGEPLEHLLPESMDGLGRLRGFGIKKRAQTIANLRAIAVHLGWDPHGVHRPLHEIAVEAKPLSLAQYGLPDSFPVEATFLAQRARDYCSSAEIVTLVELIENVSLPGWNSSVFAYKNMGKKSVEEILGLVRALKSGIKASVKEFIPIRLLSEGIDFGAAAEREAQEHQPVGFEGMHQRFVRGQTLDCVATGCSVTRERVRQVETLLPPNRRLRMSLSYPILA